MAENNNENKKKFGEKLKEFFGKLKSNKKKKTTSNDLTQESTDVVGTRSKKSKKTKKKRTVKQTIWLIIKICLLFGIVCVIGVCIYVGTVISKADKIDTSDISSLLSQSSYLYDTDGNIIDTTYSSQNRTIVEISEVPDHVQQAFIALEDRKFYTHHGINIVRMIGAVKDAVFGGGEISGTSTITQQLARNVFLTETMSVRSIGRKVTEIYYALILEKELTKDQIMEGYLNTINFGLGYGIQTVSQTYFSKDVSELTIAEAAALATLPQAPSYYALVKRIDLDAVENNKDHLIKTDEYYGYIWNDKAADRMKYCLATMYEMGFITEEEYNEAKKVEIKDIVNPNFDALNSYETNYFADYVIDQVISDFMSEYGYSYSKAYELVYCGGLRIYTTQDSVAQAVVDEQVEIVDNYPTITPKYNSDGNIVNPDNTSSVIYYKYSWYLDSDGVFTLRNDEYKKNDDGSITIYFKGRVAFYPYTYNGVSDVNLEFRNMFYWEDGQLYTLNGGIINVPRGYKTLNDDNTVTISAQFFIDYPEFFKDDGNGNLSTTHYSLRQVTVQPQVAITIVDNATGAIKAMCGGRDTTGRSILNRATSNFQPGSSIKAFTVYSAALQNSYELSQQGKYQSFWNTGFDLQGTNFYGNYITAASVFDDEPLTVEGRIWPKNDDGSYSGIVSFRYAIQQSINVIAVKIAAQLGVGYQYELAEKFGITSLDSEYDLNYSSLALGGTYAGVNTVEIASAMTTFVNQGVHKSYYCYEKVTTRSGTVLLEPTKTETKVLDEGVAWIMRDVLQSVVSYGTPWRAAISGEKVGGKTGTTDLQENLWFNGFTANYSCSIWVGPDVRMQTNGWGGTNAAGLFKAIMSKIPNALGGTYSGKPSNVTSVTIENSTGLLAVEGSTDTRVEYFTRGTEPTTSGTLYATVNVCTLSGKLATDYCDASHVISFTGTQRPYVPSDKIQKILETEVPHEYCDVCDPEAQVTYKTYNDENGNPVLTKEGLRIMIRVSDNAFVTIDENDNVEVYNTTSEGELELDDEGYPVKYVHPPVTMINVVGMTLEEATTALEALGLKVGTVTDDIITTGTEGLVTSQSETLGDEVAYGSTIDLAVTKLQAADPNPDPEPNPEP